MLIHYFIFYKRIKIYQPIAITIKNIPYPKNISLRITGITTFDKIYIFVYDQKNCKWEHGYSFIKTIYEKTFTKVVYSCRRGFYGIV